MAARQIIAQLADRFEKWQTLNVANRAADFDKHEINAFIAFKHEFFDVVGDMRDDLHGTAEIITAALFGDNVLVDAASGDVVAFGRGASREALVMTQIEVGLGTIIGDEAFAVLIGAHRARINVQIGVEFAKANRVTSGLKESTQSRRRKPFAQRGHHATGDENVPCHGVFLLEVL